MAIINIQEEWNGRGGSFEFKVVQLLGQISRTYSRSYKVETNDPTDEANVIAFPFLPLGLSYPRDPWALLHAVHCNQDPTDAYNWKVQLEYTNQIDPSWFVDSPLLRPPIWKLSFRKEKEAMLTVWQDALDENGDLTINTLTPALNSAQFPFDPPLEREKNIPQIQVQVNVPAATVDFYNFCDYEGGVNLDNYRGCPPATLRVAGIDLSEQLWENQWAYYTVNWTLEFNDLWLNQGGTPGGWRTTKVLDAGLLERTWTAVINGVVTDLTPIQASQIPGSVLSPRPIRINGQPVTQPHPLNGAGQAWVQSDPHIYLNFNLYADKLRTFTGVLP